MAGLQEHQLENIRRLRGLNNNHRALIALRDICTGNTESELVYINEWEKTVKDHATVSGKMLGPRAQMYLDASRRQLERHGYIEWFKDDSEVVRVTKKWKKILEEVNHEVPGLCVDMVAFLQVFQTIRRKFTKLKALTRRELENENRKLRRENADLRQQPQPETDQRNRSEYGVQTVFDLTSDDDLDMEDPPIASTSSAIPHRGSNVLFNANSTSTPIKSGSINNAAAYPSPPITPASRSSTPSDIAPSLVIPARNPGSLQSISPISEHDSSFHTAPSPHTNLYAIGDDEDSPMYDDADVTFPNAEPLSAMDAPDEMSSQSQNRSLFSFPFSPMALFRAYRARDAYKRQAIKAKVELRKANKKVKSLEEELEMKNGKLTKLDAREKSLLSQQAEAAPLIQQLFSLYKGVD